MSSFNNSPIRSEEFDRRARARFLFLVVLAFLFLTVGLVVALVLRGNIDASSYDPLLGVWNSVDGQTSIEFSAGKTMTEKYADHSASVTYLVRVKDPNTLILSAPDGSTRAVDWLISEEGVLVLVSGERAVTYRR